MRGWRISGDPMWPGLTRSSFGSVKKTRPSDEGRVFAL